MKVVLDTNTLISALINPYGKPARILKLLLTGTLEILLDERIMGEYAEVAARSKFGFSSDETSLVLDFLRKHGSVPLPYEGPPIRLPDPDDVPFVEVALSGGADAIVTGNKKHFPKKCIRKIKIINADELLESLNKNAQ